MSATQEKAKPLKDKDLLEFEWRTGTQRTAQAKCIYAQMDEKPSKDDVLLGEMKSPTIAKRVIEAHNAWFD